MYLDDCGHLLGENIKEFDLGRDSRSVFSVGKQSQPTERYGQGKQG